MKRCARDSGTEVDVRLPIHGGLRARADRAERARRNFDEGFEIWAEPSMVDLSRIIFLGLLLDGETVRWRFVIQADDHVQQIH